MARYIGFSTKFYGKCDGVSTNVGFALKDIPLIKQDLLNHLFTTRGERVMQPTFGSIIPDLLFEPFDDQIITLVEEEISRIVASDPRLVLLNIHTTPDYDNSQLSVSIMLQYVELNIVDGFELDINFQ